MMITINDLVNTLFRSKDGSKTERPTQKYYALVNKDTLKIDGISSTAYLDRAMVEIDEKLASDFLNDIEDTNDWIVWSSNDTYEIRKAEKITPRFNKIETAPLHQISIQPAANIDLNNLLGDGDVAVLINRADGIIHIYYNGEEAKKPNKAVRIYITKQGDPSYLMCAVRLSAEGLDDILKHNDLIEWPNPLILKLQEGTDDIMILAQKTSAIISAFEME